MKNIRQTLIGTVLSAMLLTGAAGVVQAADHTGDAPYAFGRECVRNMAQSDNDDGHLGQRYNSNHDDESLGMHLQDKRLSAKPCQGTGGGNENGDHHDGE